MTARVGRRLTLTAAVLVTAVSALATQQPSAGQVDALFEEWDRPASPGCALGVIRDGALVYTSGYGDAELERGTPITPNGVFYIASVSKQFTATAAVLLALDGRLSLDDDIRQYVPELPDYGSTISIRHLLTHTSGLRDYLSLMEYAGMSLEQPWEPAEILALITRQEELNFAPGTQYLYSNTGYFLIPIIVERVTGQPFRAFVDERIFRPLGMRDSRFHDDYTRPVERRVLSYRGDRDDGFELDFLETFDQVGSGGLLTTVEDLARWDDNFYTGVVGGTELLEALQTRGILANGDTIHYALGLQISDYKGVRTVSHGGSMMGFRTHLLRFPDERFSVICLCNLGGIDPGRLASQVADHYLEGRFHEQLTAYAGPYRSRELGNAVELRVAAGALMLHPPVGEPIELRSLGGDRFEVEPGLTLEFLRDEGGTVILARLNGGRARGIRYVRE